MYACSHPNPGAWFQAKLNNIMAVIPTVAPSRSSSRIRSLCERLRTSSSRGTEGSIKIERMARQKSAMPNVQKVHGHHKSDQRPANVPPTTAPPTKRQGGIPENHTNNTYRAHMLQIVKIPCPSSFPHCRSRLEGQVHWAVILLVQCHPKHARR